MAEDIVCSAPPPLVPPSSGESPLVSILIAAFNAGRFLEEAVRSALAQTLSDLEVIIIDDASTDDSWITAERLMQHDPRVRSVRSEMNGGPAAARNHGLRIARGRWIAVLDADDLFHPDRLRRLILHAESHEADLIADDLLIFGDDQEDRTTLLGGGRAHARWLGASDYLRATSNWGAGGDLGYLKPVFRAEALRSRGIVYDERLRVGEDDDLVLRLLLEGARYRLMPVPSYFYRKHASSISHRVRREHLVAMIRASERHVMAARPDLRRAMRRRLKNRRRALRFDQMVEALKSRDWTSVSRYAVAIPSPLPLLKLPLRARWHRWRQRPSPFGRERQAGMSSSGVVAFEGEASAANALGLRWLLQEVWPMVREKRPGARLFVYGSVAQLLEPARQDRVGRAPIGSPVPSDAVRVFPALLTVAPGPPVPCPARSGLMVATRKAAETLNHFGCSLVVEDNPADFARAIVAFLPSSKEDFQR